MKPTYDLLGNILPKVKSTQIIYWVHSLAALNCSNKTPLSFETESKPDHAISISENMKLVLNCTSQGLTVWRTSLFLSTILLTIFFLCEFGCVRGGLISGCRDMCTWSERQSRVCTAPYHPWRRPISMSHYSVPLMNFSSCSCHLFSVGLLPHKHHKSDSNIKSVFKLLWL